MKQENLDELKNIYLGLVTGGEGPEVLSEVANIQTPQQRAKFQKQSDDYNKREFSNLRAGLEDTLV